MERLESVVVWTFGGWSGSGSGGKKGKLCRFTSRAGKCKSTCRSRNRWTGKRTAWFERAPALFPFWLDGWRESEGEESRMRRCKYRGESVENGDRRENSGRLGSLVRERTRLDETHESSVMYGP